jgi:RimJ/RimL family protein N-acetyltransferase
MEAVVAGDLASASAALGSPVSEEWAEGVADLFRMRLEQVSHDPSVLPWLARAMLLVQPDRSAVGHIGFHGAPDDRGFVEVGYTVLPEHRRRGYAEEAVRALFDWAAREHGIRRFRASVGPWNEPSLRLVAKLGFLQTGTQWDEIDGEELVFELVREEAAPLRARP